MVTVNQLEMNQVHLIRTIVLRSQHRQRKLLTNDPEDVGAERRET